MPPPAPRLVRAACSPPQRAGISVCASRQTRRSATAHRTHLLEALLGVAHGVLCCLCVVRAHRVQRATNTAVQARRIYGDAGPAPGSAATTHVYGRAKNGRPGDLLEDVDKVADILLACEEASRRRLPAPTDSLGLRAARQSGHSLDEGLHVCEMVDDGLLETVALPVATHGA